MNLSIYRHDLDVSVELYDARLRAWVIIAFDRCTFVLLDRMQF
jgi:hypothetical protein